MLALPLWNHFWGVVTWVGETVAAAVIILIVVSIGMYAYSKLGR